MSFNLIFTLLQITTLVSAQFGGKGKGAETDGGVLVLTEKNFIMEALDRPWFLVEFYAPWCQHCQKMEPVYSDAAKMLQMHSPMLHIGKVNTDENKMLKEEYGIQSFPTFIVFKNGNYLESYSGAQHAKGIYNAVVKGNHGEDEETDCKTIAKMKKKQKDNYHAVYFGPKDHPFYEGIYKPFFDFIQDDPQGLKLKFGVRWNNDPKCAEEMQVGFPSIMWYKKFDEKLNEYTADQEPTFEAFFKWYFFHLAPFPFKLSEYAEMTIGSNHPIMLLFRSEGKKDEDYAAEFEQAAIESFEKKEQIFYAFTSLDDEYSERLAKHFDFERAQLPQIRIHAMNQKFKPEKFSSLNATAPLIKEWLQDTMLGNSQAYARVQKEPKYNDGAIKILNTNTLYEFLETPGTQKIVLFYEPFIGERMEVYLRPIIWELAEIYRDAGLTGEGKIQFGEFNRLENENDQFPSNGNVDFYFFGDDFKTLRNYGEDIKSSSLARVDIKNWFEDVSYHLSGKPKPEETPQEEAKEETKEAEKVEEGVKAEL